MVLVLPLSAYVQIHLSGVAKALEEMQEHFCGHLADAFAVKLCIPYQPGASAEVETHLTETVVHR